MVTFLLFRNFVFLAVNLDRNCDLPERAKVDFVKTSSCVEVRKDDEMVF